MRYAIIAAGEGSRLASEGVIAPKPLVEVNGECLIDRLIRIFMNNGAEEIVVICNDRTTLVSDHLADVQTCGLNGCHVPLHYIVKSTPSSMHSFSAISDELRAGAFCLTTVDTIFREKEFAEYVTLLNKKLADGIDGLMGVTDFIDDEKPLYVGVDAGNNITGFYDEKHSCTDISGGIYGLSPRAIETLDGCMQRGESRMRNFQRALITDGRKIEAYRFSKVLDIDHASDIVKAEQFLNAESR